MVSSSNTNVHTSFTSPVTSSSSSETSSKSETSTKTTKNEAKFDVSGTTFDLNGDNKTPVSRDKIQTTTDSHTPPSPNLKDLKKPLSELKQKTSMRNLMRPNDNEENKAATGSKLSLNLTNLGETKEKEPPIRRTVPTLPTGEIMGKIGEKEPSGKRGVDFSQVSESLNDICEDLTKLEKVDVNKLKGMLIDIKGLVNGCKNGQGHEVTHRALDQITARLEMPDNKNSIAEMKEKIEKKSDAPVTKIKLNFEKKEKLTNPTAVEVQHLRKQADQLRNEIMEIFKSCTSTADIRTNAKPSEEKKSTTRFDEEQRNRTPEEMQTQKEQTGVVDKFLRTFMKKAEDLMPTDEVKTITNQADDLMNENNALVKQCQNYESFNSVGKKTEDLDSNLRVELKGLNLSLKDLRKLEEKLNELEEKGADIEDYVKPLKNIEKIIYSSEVEGSKNTSKERVKVAEEIVNNLREINQVVMKSMATLEIINDVELTEKYFNLEKQEMDSKKSLREFINDLTVDEFKKPTGKLLEEKFKEIENDGTFKAAVEAAINLVNVTIEKDNIFKQPLVDITNKRSGLSKDEVWDRFGGKKETIKVPKKTITFDNCPEKAKTTLKNEIDEQKAALIIIDQQRLNT